MGDEIIKAGYLIKEGENVKNWRKRWFVLRQTSLQYYKEKTDTTPQGSIPLSDCSCAIIPFAEIKRANCVKLVTPKRTFFIASLVDGPEDILSWVEAVFKAGVAETREDEQVMNFLLESVNLVSNGAVTLVSCANSGPLEGFREACKIAISRGDALVSHVQALSKYNSGKLFSTPNYFNDVINEATNIANSIRDTINAMVHIAREARESPNDAEAKRRLSNHAVTVADKIQGFKKMLQAEKGIKAHVRSALYGSHKERPTSGAIAQPTSRVGHSATLSSVPTSVRDPADPKAVQFSPKLRAPTSPQFTVASVTPANPSPLEYTTSPRPFSDPAPVSPEHRILYDDIIRLSKELSGLMKNAEIDEATGSAIDLPKQGQLTAISLVKATKEYANLQTIPQEKQEVLRCAARVFFVTNQLYSPIDLSASADESIRYSADELLRALSQSVVVLIKKVVERNQANQPSNSYPPPLSKSLSTGNLDPNAPQRTGLARSTDAVRKILLEQKQNSAASIFDSVIEGDVNIWEEPAIVGTNVMFLDEDGGGESGNRPIKAGTINQLVIRLTNETEPDLKFVKAFITTYQSFTTPEFFLHKLIQRYQVPLSVMETAAEQQLFRKSIQLPIQLRVFNVLRQWVETRFLDFDESISSKMNLFMNECLRKDGHAKLADSLSVLICKKSAPELKKTLKLSTPSTAAVFYKKYTTESILALDEDEVAKQMCLIEMEYYRSIEPTELLNQSWNKADLRHRSPNVTKMIQRFNTISNFVARAIVYEEKLRQRGKLMTKFIRIGQALHKYCNFNSLLAIMAGLGNSSIHRLKLTAEEVSTKDMESTKNFAALMSSDKGYKNYRGAIHKVNPPLIPYLGVYLTDLTFIEDGNPDKIGGLINFRKRDMIYDVILEIQQYQHLQYSFAPVDSIIKFLSEIPIIEDAKAVDAELFEQSLLREPRAG